MTSDSDSSRARAAFQEGAALVDLTGTVDVLWVRGADAGDYLQRMISADVRRVTESAGRPATLMTNKGKMVAAFDLYRHAEEFLAVVESSAVVALAEALERLIILEEVEVSRDPAPGALLTLQGPAATEILSRATGAELGEKPFASGALGDDDGAPLALYRARSAAGGWDLVVRDGAAAFVAALETAGAVPASFELAERFRIDAGLPRFGVDADATHMPPEAGYDAAIAYDKGCYAGQEVVARIRTYGHVNRRLCLLRLAATELPAPGDEIHGVERRLGEVTSSTLSPTTGDAIALGYVRLKGGEPGTDVVVRSAGGAVRAVVEPLPWENQQ